MLVWSNSIHCSSFPISWPSVKPLAQILFKISCWKGFILMFSKCQNFQRAIHQKKIRCFFFLIYSGNLLIIPYQLTFHASSLNTRFYFDSFKGVKLQKKKVTWTRKKKTTKKTTKHWSFIFPWGIYIWNFKILASTVHKIWFASDFIQFLFKGA